MYAVCAGILTCIAFSHTTRKMTKGSFKYAKILKMNTRPNLKTGTPMSESEAQQIYNFSNSWSCGMKLNDERLLNLSSSTQAPVLQQKAVTHTGPKLTLDVLSTKQKTAPTMEKLSETPRALNPLGYAAF